MYFIYSLLLGLAFIILLPRFLLDAFRHGKYVAGFRERLGSLASLPHNGRPVVWIHCVSVGGHRLPTLVKGLKERSPPCNSNIHDARTGRSCARDFKTTLRGYFFLCWSGTSAALRALSCRSSDHGTELCRDFCANAASANPLAIVTEGSGRAVSAYRMPRLCRGFPVINLAICKQK